MATQTIKVADKPTLDLVKGDTSDIKTAIAGLGGGGYALKCVESGSFSAAVSTEITSTTGGLLLISSGSGGDPFTELVIDGVSLAQEQMSAFTPYNYKRWIPFRNSITLKSSATVPVFYVLYKYDAI